MELPATVSQVYDDLGVPLAGAVDSPLAHVLWITAQVRELERSALRGGVNQAFAIGCSLYRESLNLEALSEGSPEGLGDDVVEKLENNVAPHAQALADKLEDVVLPRRG